MGAWKRRSLSSSRPREGELEIGKLLYPETPEWRPQTRADCVNGPRPCPYVACKYNLYLDVDAHDNVITAPGEPWDVQESCSLDLAAKDPLGYAEIGGVMHLSPERIRQIEFRALYKIRSRLLRVLG